MKASLVLNIELPGHKRSFFALFAKKLLHFVINDAFSHFVVINPKPQIASKHASQTFLNRLITNFAPLPSESR